MLHIWKRKGSRNGAFSFLGGRIEGIREYRSFCRFFVMVEKHSFCVLLFRKEIAMYYTILAYDNAVVRRLIESRIFKKKHLIFK